MLQSSPPLKKFINDLLEPSGLLLPDQRHQSRLLMKFLLFLLVVGGVYQLLFMWLIQTWDGVWESLANMAVMLAAYLLCRRGSWKIAAVSITALLYGMIVTITLDTPHPYQNIGFLKFTVIPLLVASVFFSNVVIAYMSILFSLGIVGLKLIVPSISLIDLFADTLPFLWIVTGIIQVGKTHQKTLETERQTELKRSEERFRRLAENHDLILSSAAEGILGLDVQGFHTFVNASAAKMLGYAAEELIGKPSHSVWHHTKADGTPYPEQECKIHATYQYGIAQRVYSETFWRKDGACFPVEYASTPIYESGKLAGAVVTFTDITERKLAEEALKESEQKFTGVFQYSPIPMLLVDAATMTILNINRAYSASVGYDKEEIINIAGKAGIALGPDQLHLIQQILEEKGYLENREVTITTKHGDERLGLISIEPIKIQTGHFYLVSFVDITERKEAEERLRTREEQYRFLLDNTSDFIARYDQNSVMVFGTDAAHRFHGYELNEIIHTPGLARIHPEDCNQVRGELKRMLETGVEGRVEYRLKHKNGEYIWVEAVGRRVFNASGEPEIIVVQRDITERKQAEKDLAASQELTQATIDGLAAHICVLDARGVIISVNRAWRRFAESNPPVPPDYGVGSNYIAVCENARGEDESIARRTAAGLRALLDGGLSEYQIEYPCHSPDEQRWFFLKAAKFESGGELHLVISHENITEGKLAEQSLRESEERLELVMDGSQLGFWDWNIETGKVHRNARWAEMLGYTLEEIELSVKQWTDLHHPDDQAAAWKSIQDHLEGGTPAHRIEYRMRAKDGQYKWILDQARVVKRDAQGKPLRMSGTHTDVTERKQAEASLLEAERKYRLLVEQSPAVVYVDELGGHWQYLSPQVEKMLGVTAEELTNNYGMYGKRIHPDDRAEVYARVRACVELQQRTIAEYRVLSRDNQYIWIHDEMDPSTDPITGKVYLRGVFYDITKRKLAEEALRQSERRLREAQTVGRIGDWEIDVATGKLFYSNEMFELLERDPVLGAPEIQDATKYLEPEEAEVMQSLIMRAMQTGAGWERDLHIVLPSGREVWHRSIGTVTKDSEGNALKILGVAQDVTVQKLAEKALRESEERFSKMFQSSPIGIALTDIISAEMFDVNDAFAKIWGCVREDLIGRTTTEMRLWEFPEERKAALHDLMKNGSIKNYDIHAIKKSGERILVKFSAELIDLAGKKYLLGNYEDITDLKRAEENLKTSEALYRQAITAAGAVPYYRDYQADGEKYAFMGEGILQLTGYSADEITPEIFDQLERESIMRGSLAHLTQAEAGNLSGAGKIQHWACDYRIETRTGQTRWIADSAVQVRDENDRRIGVIGILQDITERKKSEEVTRHYNEQLTTVIKIQNKLTSSLDEGMVGANLSQGVQQLFPDAAGIFISRFDAERKKIKAMYGFQDREEVDVSGLPELSLDPDGKGTQSKVIHSRQPLLINHNLRGNFVNKNLLLIGDEREPQSALYVPILMQEKVLGLIQVQCYDENRFTEDDMRALMLIANAAASSMENARLYSISQSEIAERKQAESVISQRVLELEMLYETGLTFNQILSPKQIGRKIIEILEQNMQWHHIVVRLHDAISDSLYVLSFSVEERLEGKDFKNPVTKTGMGMAGWAFQHSQVVRSGDVNQDPRYMEAFSGMNSGIYVPMKSRRRSIGVISIESERANAFSETDERLVSTLANQAAAAIENARLYESVQKELMERKQAEERIHMQMVALESAANGIIITDVRGNIQWVNPAWCTLTGYTFEEAIGQNPRILKSGKQDGDFYKTLWQTILAGNTWRSELINRRKDGSLYDEETTITPVRNEAGEIAHFIGVKLDITERKRAERVMQARLRLASSSVRGNIEEFLRMRLDEAETLTESSIGFFHFVEGDQRTISLQTWSTHTLENMCQAEGKGQHYPVEQAGIWVEAIKDKAPRIYNDYVGAANKKGLPQGHAELTRFIAIPLIRDGLVVALVGVGNKASDYTQQDVDIVTQLVSETWDIILRKRAEEALQKMNAELEQRVQERTAEVRDLYENAPAGYHSVDAEGKIVAINQTELNWLGYTLQEMLGQPISNFLTPASQQIFDGQFPAFKMNGLAKDLELEFVHKNGSTFPTLINGTAIYDNQGNFLMSRSTVFDNTEHKKAEEALRRANLEMERALRMKDEFLATMSHELRTPLTGILGLSEALQMKVYGDLNEKQTKTLKTIEESGRHLLDLINDILDVSKIEAGKLDLQMEPCSLKDICQSSLQMVKGMAGKKRQTMDFTMSHEDIVLRGDMRRLKQIFVNLLSNAVKFSSEGGSFGMEVQKRGGEHRVEITVWDHGAGILPEDLPKLFQPFVQLDSSLTRQQAGTGLGLALVKRLVNLHGGSVRVESVPGAGSRFTVSLPYLPSDATQRRFVNLPMKPQTGGEVAIRKPSAVVMVVDDNEINIALIKDFLESQQLTVTTAYSGKDFLARVTEVRPDIILMDIQMPDVDGLEATRSLRSMPEPRVASIPVIAVTALAMPGDRERCLQAGANEYMSKPLNLQQLLSVIKQQIGSNL